MISRVHHEGIEVEVGGRLQDLLPAVERWHGVEAKLVHEATKKIRNGLNGRLARVAYREVGKVLISKASVAV
jgi:hypothetical protein